MFSQILDSTAGNAAYAGLRNGTGISGSFTPTFTTIGGATFTYTRQVGRWTKIGRWVFIHVEITYSNCSANEAVLFASFPFTPDPANLYVGSGFISDNANFPSIRVRWNNGALAVLLNDWTTATTFAFSQSNYNNRYVFDMAYQVA